MSPAPQLEAERDEQRAEDDRVRADPDGDREAAWPWGQYEQDSEGEREKSREPEEPLSLDHLAEPDRGRDLEDPGDDRPHRDQVDQRDRGGRRIHEGDDA